MIPPYERRLGREFPELDVRKFVDAFGELTAEELVIWSEVGKEYFHFFTVFVLGYDRLTPEPGVHWQLCERLQRLEEPLFLLWHRGGFKSTIGTVSWLLHGVACDHEGFDSVMIFSDPKLGRQMLAELGRFCDPRQRLSDVVLSLYPELERDREMWDKDMKRVRGSRRRGATFELLTTNRGWAGRHVQRVVIDDLVNEDNYTSRDEQDKLTDRLRRIWPNIDTDELLMCGTRYADYDAYRLPLTEWYPAGVMDVLVQPLKGTASLTELGEVVLDDEGNDGAYANPFEWDEPEEAKERERIGIAHIFRTQYYLDTSHQEGVSFEADWIQRMLKAEMPPLTVYVAGDAASGEGSSRPAIMAGGISGDGKIVFLGARCDYTTEADFVDGLFEFCQLFGAVRVGLEGWGPQKFGIPQQVKARSQETGVWLDLDIVPGTTQKKKDQIILETLRAPYKWGNVYHGPGITAGGEYEAQLDRFPKGRYKDLLDAARMVVQMALRYGYWGPEAEKREETEEEPSSVSMEGRFKKLLEIPDEEDLVGPKARFW